MGNIVNKIVHGTCNLALNMNIGTLKFVVQCVKKSLGFGDRCLEFVCNQ